MFVSRTGRQLLESATCGLFVSKTYQKICFALCRLSRRAFFLILFSCQAMRLSSVAGPGLTNFQSSLKSSYEKLEETSDEDDAYLFDYVDFNCSLRQHTAWAGGGEKTDANE
ncbi:MAG TPA: hypothetical protein P5183_10065 [Smithellaceae bacterium]|nr:hypothetical protein [Smithellaceae bacterium]